MSFTLVKKATDGTYAAETDDRGIGSQTLSFLKQPFGMFGDNADSEFMSRKEAAYGTLVWVGVAGLVGELIGYKGAKSGRKAVIARVIPALA